MSIYPRSGRFDRQVAFWQKQIAQDPNNGSQSVTWVPLVPLAGSPVLPTRWRAEVQDVLPSRSEAVQDGLQFARNQSRLRMRYRSDIDSNMKVTVYGDGPNETDKDFQIVGGPAFIAGRKQMLEMVLETYTSSGDSP